MSPGMWPGRRPSSSPGSSSSASAPSPPTVSPPTNTYCEAAINGCPRRASKTTKRSRCTSARSISIPTMPPPMRRSVIPIFKPSSRDGRNFATTSSNARKHWRGRPWHWTRRRPAPTSCSPISTSLEDDIGEQLVGAGRRRVQCQGLPRQCFRAFELVVAKFRPSRDDGLKMGITERRIGGGIVGIEIDRALVHLLRFVVLLARRGQPLIAASQYVFVGGETVGGLGADALLLEPGELDGRRPGHMPGDILLHRKDVLGLAVVGIGPNLPPGRGFGQICADADAIADATDAARE